jgi:hypothetical protein
MILIVIILSLPCVGFSQSNADDYDIYSSYLKSYQKQTGKGINYVIRVSGDFKKYNNASDIAGILIDFRNYLKDGKDAGLFFQCSFFRDTLKTDTSWLQLIGQLHQKMQKEYNIQNKFSKGLQISMLTDSHYTEYFDNGNIEQGWSAFHDDYPDNSLLVSLSQIINDGKRAVFYISQQCGGLCGAGYMVLFYKDVSGWRFVGTIPIWMS